MIDNRFLFFRTLNGFLNALLTNDIHNDSIVFIADTQLIWTHGIYFTPEVKESIKHVFTTQSEYNALSEYADDTIYFILEGDKQEWKFGDKFPITFIGTEEWKFGDKFPIILTGEWKFGGTFPIILTDTWAFGGTFPITFK